MYLIFDLDDTLLTSDKIITKYTQKIIKNLSNEHIIVINSARSFEFSKKYMKKINATYNITNGGAQIYKKNKLIYEKLIDSNTINEAINLFKQYNINDFSIQSDKQYTSSKNYANTNKQVKYFNFNNSFNKNASKIVFKTKDKKLANEIASKLNLNLISYLNSDFHRLSLTNKNDGNIALYNILNDPCPKSIAFGDDIGDLEMLSNSTLGVAMKNSVNLILDKIPTKTKYSNNEDGCAKFLYEYFLKKND